MHVMHHDDINASSALSWRKRSDNDKESECREKERVLSNIEVKERSLYFQI